jgi:hypothetical protein
MCEGWNNNFFNLVGHTHPSIWRVIEWCQKEEATVRTIIQQDEKYKKLFLLPKILKRNHHKER